MLRTLFTLVALLGSALAVRAGVGWQAWLNPELRELQRAAAEKHAVLAALGEPMVGQTVPEFGAQHVMVVTPPPESPWVQVDLGEETTFDRIALVPAVVDFESVKRTAYAFPPRFRLDASNDPTFATFTPLLVLEDDAELHGIGPLVAATPGARARYVRLTVTKLAAVEGRWTFALAELMILRGQRNVAISCPVTFTALARLPRRWMAENLTDGRTPLGPPIDRSSVPEFDALFASIPEPGKAAWMGLDLGREVAVEEVRLHPLHARQGADVPGFRFPKEFRVELAATEDFADATVLFDTAGNAFPNPGNNSVTLRAAGQRGRFVRVVMIAPEHPTSTDMALSELEVFVDGVNVARDGKPMSSGDPRRTGGGRPLALLNDGHTSYGRLLTLPEWLDRWVQRSSLEDHVAVLAKRAGEAEATAWRRLAWLVGGVVGLALVGGVVLAVRVRRRRLREVEQFRQQLAQDLHDEIGSNLAGIARLSEVAADAGDGTAEDWREVRRIASESTDAMREVLWLVGARQESGMDLSRGLRQVAARTLAGKDVRWLSEDETFPPAWPMEARRHVFLFFKEALTNVVRHARADRVELWLRRENATLEVGVRDCGVGFDPAKITRGVGLRSLHDRARTLHGALRIDSTPGTGTCVTLRVPLPEN